MVNHAVNKKNTIQSTAEVKTIFFLITVVLFYLFFLQVYAVWPFTIDDMYISLRYAKHWSEGFGLLWNINEPAVEGYSNFSFVYFARLALLWGISPIMTLKLIGVIGLFVSMISVYLLTRFWVGPRLAWIPSIWLLAYQGEIEWSVSGLETAIYQASICCSVVCLFWGLGFRLVTERQIDSELSHYDWTQIKKPSLSLLAGAGVLLAFASMTRPEAPALVLLFILLLSIFHAFLKKQFWRVLVVFIGTYTLFFAPYFFWRWQYFGRFFPNTVYCKGITGAMTFTLDKQYLKLLWPFILMAMLPMIKRYVLRLMNKHHSLLTIPKLKIQDIKLYFLWLPSVVYGILLIDADPIVAFDNRLFLPVFALFLPVAFLGMHRLLNNNSTLMNYSVALLFTLCFIPMKTIHGYRYFALMPQAGEKLRQQVSQWLSQHTNADSQIVLADSGLIPYETPRHFIDSYCLNNADMTRYQSTNMYETFCQQIFDRQPEIIILTSLINHGHTIYTPTDACIAKKISNKPQYQWQKDYSFRHQHMIYRYQIYRLSKGYSKIS